jgi:NAD(P)H-hydrate epimerase
MKILTAAQMREMDRLTVERCGIPYDTLMETAGRRVVEAIINKYGTQGSFAGKRVSVFSGKGNNGGDGAVIARHLWMKGAQEVSLYLLGNIAETKGESRANFEAFQQLSLQTSDEQSGRQIRFIEISAESDNPALYSSDTDLIVDALFGTGLVRAAQGMFAAAITVINRLHQSAVPVVAVDIPSGLSSDSEKIIGPHVQADLTVSFTAPKPGNVLPPACYANGKLIVADIGTPHSLIEEESGSQLALIEESLVADFLTASRRAPDAHKGSAGDVLLIAGSRGKTGAAALSSEAVLRAGAGLVTTATSISAQSLLVTQVCNEAMTESLPETECGAIAHAALTRALQLAQKRTVLAIGPGMSARNESTRRFAREFVQQRTAPLIIDADGLNCLAPWPDALQGSPELPIIITPHPGEMARLTAKTNAEILADRRHIVREFATRHHIITILKGSRALIGAPDGAMYVNPTGNAGMATAGSGDVLTGLMAGLLAQKPDDPLQAAIAAVYLHGLAGDIAARLTGMRSLMAGDICRHLATAILQIGGEAEKTW